MLRTTLFLPSMTLFAITASALAGDPNPPAGPIDGTMKTLDQIEPRVAINDLPGAADAEHVITEPGNYYLTGNVTAQAGRSAVVVDLASDPADDPVTIDLNGFSIIGQAGSLDGVRFTADFENGRYVLRQAIPLTGDGGAATASIAGMGGHAVSYTGSPALVDGAAPILISGLAISNCGGDAVHVENASGTYVFDLTVTDNIGLTSFVSGVPSPNTTVVIENVTASNCAAGGAVIQDRAEVRVEKFNVRNCGGPGLDVTAAPGGPFKFDTRTGDLTSNNGPAIRVDVSGTTGAAIRVNDTTCVNNTSHGIHVIGNNLQSTVPGEPVGGINVSLEQIVGMTNGGDGALIEFDGSAAPRVHSVSSTYRDNAGDGLHCAGSFGVVVNINSKDDDASLNGGSGLHVSGNLTVSGATLNGNGGDGLQYVAPGEPVGGINVSLEQITGSNNQGSGATFSWRQLGGPYAMRVADSSFTGNTLDGLFSDDDNTGEGVIHISECRASSNGLGGFVVGNDPPAAGTQPRKSTYVWDSMADLNANGPGFSITNCRRAEIAHCSATQNSTHGYIVSGPEIIVDDSDATDNQSNGYDTQGNEADYAHCRASGNGGNGYSTIADAIRLRLCSATGNGGDGYDLDQLTSGVVTLTDCDATFNEGNGNTCVSGSLTISDGSYCRNTGNGASIEVSGSLTVSGATMCDNTGSGLTHASTTGIPASSVSIDHCVCSGNNVSGISVADSFGGRIQHCTANANGVSGVEVLAFSHVVTNNMCANNIGSNYAVSLPGNALGPIQDESSAPTTDNASNYQP